MKVVSWEDVGMEEKHSKVIEKRAVWRKSIMENKEESRNQGCIFTERKEEGEAVDNMDQYKQRPMGNVATIFWRGDQCMVREMQ